MIKSMQEIVHLLTAQQTQIFELVEFDERPILGPPVDQEQLSRLRKWWIKKGGVLPESYQDFLLVCDGIENFCLSYSLFGASDLLSDSYSVLLKEVLEVGTGYDYNIDLPPILIGYDTETTTRVFFDLFHEPLDSNEPIVLEGNPGDMSLHESFRAFLEFRVKTNEITISHLLKLRAKQFED